MIDASQADIPAIIEFIIVIFMGMTLLFSLLVFRQVGQMNQVLPTKLSPVVRFLALGYTGLCALAIILALVT
jgi:hypothetical protein